ncbi:YheT family hydrolase [Roseimaritima ulvae]|uniref:Putative hydrolase n=1 Tax=Roseimaritima ulvae TaxID=980254 RepID=A0A5B9R3N5_9BACT|nr:alpha/beta fold hydrolase [Roseimaritima ulvae]QEG40943.1 putative hydrolase [Roseimaritima ulvae]
MSEHSESTGAVAALDCLSPFVPHRWWRGGWLQTLSIKMLSKDLQIESWPGSTLIRIPDDRTPPDTLMGHYLPPKQPRGDRPTVLLFHGMGGHAKSGYMQSIAAKLLDHGYPVLLWNQRGAGSSRSECSHYHHPGYTDDIRRLLKHLRDKHPQYIEHGVNAAAFSLGANPMLRFLAEEGDACPISAAVSISAPLDMKITSKNLRNGWNRVFDRYLLRKQREELLRPQAKLSDDERQAVKRASSVWELDDQLTAKRFGYDGAEEYYQANSAIDVLDKIRTPTLFLHALDDPVVDNDVFEQRSWSDDGPLFAALVQSGGHTGFLDREGKRWHEQCTVEFFDSRLS